MEWYGRHSAKTWSDKDALCESLLGSIAGQVDTPSGRIYADGYKLRGRGPRAEESSSGADGLGSVGIRTHGTALDGLFLFRAKECEHLTIPLKGRPRAVRQDADAHSGWPTTGVDAGVRKHGRSRCGQREEQPVSPQARQPHPPSGGPQPNDEPDRGLRNARRRRTRSCSPDAPFCVTSRFGSPATNLAKRVAVGEGILLVLPPPSERPGRYYRYSSLLIQYVNRNAPP